MHVICAYICHRFSFDSLNTSDCVIHFISRPRWNSTKHLKRDTFIAMVIMILCMSSLPVNVTLKQIICLKWNASKILCLSSLSASLKRIRSKLKALSCPQHFFRRSSAGNSEVNGMMWPEFDLIRDSRTPGYLQVWWWYDQQVAQRATIAHLSNVPRSNLISKNI